MSEFHRPAWAHTVAVFALVVSFASGIAPATAVAQPASAADATAVAAPAAAEPASAAPAPMTASPMAKESVDNPYGLSALWEQGDFVARGTLIILVIMSMGSW